MLSVKTLRVDVSQETNYVYTKCKQYDNLSRKYKILITDKGIPITMSGKEQIRIRMWAEGESSPYVDKWLDEPWEDGYPIITLTSYMLSKIGTVDFEFVIQEIGSSSIISTRLQHLSIQKSLIDYDGLISSDDFNVLSHLITQAITIPDLIADFKVTQNEIDNLILKINTDIASYQNNYSQLSVNAQELIESLQSYLNTAKSAENTRISNESIRIAAEQKRQADTSAAITRIDNAKEQAVKDVADTITEVNNAKAQAIKEMNTAKSNAEQATTDAQEATNVARQTGEEVALQGQEAVDKVNAAIQNLEYTIIDIDGGNASTATEDYTNTYDGGGA
ncbi:MAG: hypothetical protein LUH21_03805 [Clostridiales bacterium]|nr:hypothetical protein [Clostridiales bacterium]